MSTLLALRVTWASELLGALGIIPGPANMAAVVAWECAEGGGFGNVAAYNPLNTTEDMPGAFSINEVGVKAYASYEDGLTATVRTLQFGAYGLVTEDLRDGADPYIVAQAIGDSPWGTPGELVSACVPEAEQAVADYWQPPGEVTMFIKATNGTYYEKVTHQGESWLHEVPPNLAGTIPSSMVVTDNASGGWLNRYSEKIIPAA